MTSKVYYCMNRKNGTEGGRKNRSSDLTVGEVLKNVRFPYRPVSRDALRGWC